MPVVDASVLVAWLAGGEQAGAVRERLLGADEQLWAPHLVDAEVGHALRRMTAAQELRPRTASAILEDLALLPLKRAAHVGLLDPAWALRRNATFYDALYLALAERLEMVLLTLDAGLARVPGTRAPVEVVE